MKKLGNIGLGNFCKALLEHKNIKINSNIFTLPYVFKWNGERYIDIATVDKTDYTPTEIISLFLEDIYKLDYTWEIIE